MKSPTICTAGPFGVESITLINDGVIVIIMTSEHKPVEVHAVRGTIVDDPFVVEPQRSKLELLPNMGQHGVLTGNLNGTSVNGHPE